MRIVYCTPEISHPGGIGRVTTLKANWLAEHGHEVYVVTSSQCGEPNYFDLNHNVKHIDFGIGFQAGMDNTNVIKKLINKWGKMRMYEKCLRDFLYDIKADIVVSTFSNDSDFLYKFKDGSKKVLEFHFSHDGYKSVIKYGNLGYLQNLVQIYKIRKQEVIAKKYDAFVVLTREDAEAWKGYHNIHVIPNMLTFESNEVSNLSKKRVIAVGRLDYQKKFDRLIYIWKIVHEECPDWKLDIFGQGPEKEHLQEMIDAMNLHSIVSINPPTSYIREEYLQSSILAMVSSYEGWGLILSEAMTCGLPCVAYACKCGPRDIISNGIDGFLIEENDKNTFVKQLKKLIKSDELRKEMGQNAKIKSFQFSREIIMNTWINFFENIIR